MSDGFAILDILFFAVVAAFVALRLRSVLGKRTGHERQRPPRIQPQPAPVGSEASEKVVPLPDRRRTPLEETPIAADAAPDIKQGLTRLRLADPSFDLDHFLNGARTAFAMIVEAFARGDKATLEPLLAPSVFASFAAAIDERARLGQTLETRLVAISGAEVLAADLEGPIARITVRFTSEQSNCTRDASGRIVEGDPDTVETVVDVWTFERDIRSPDPNWLLVETRSGA
ncbi:MAG: Tim44/TimA family putative adaptor protein [Geminicoccaceae bacterium]|nr:Tim44/TimA family putative adaptor protein [Geminicoccaceae bacterium]MDW8340087.1 Tim44/TimA family putative adaptor protein [Geminicoccaceae bacterium]